MAEGVFACLELKICEKEMMRSVIPDDEVILHQGMLSISLKNDNFEDFLSSL